MSEVLRLKNHLLKFWPADHLVTIATSAMNPVVAAKLTTVPLGELESVGKLMHASCTLFVPAVTTSKRTGDAQKDAATLV